MGPSNIGTANETFASSGSGDIFGLFFNSMQLVVPGGYVKGAPLSGTSTYSGESFSSLGMEMGSYSWTWGSGDTADVCFGRQYEVLAERSKIKLGTMERRTKEYLAQKAA
jgi:hypothetical protein